jgi:hypothetical protein
MVQREYIRELESTEQDIRQALDHIDHERAAIQEIREHGGNAQTAEALSTRVGVSGKRHGAFATVRFASSSSLNCGRTSSYSSFGTWPLVTLAHNVRPTSGPLCPQRRYDTNGSDAAPRQEEDPPPGKRRQRRSGDKSYPFDPCRELRTYFQKNLPGGWCANEPEHNLSIFSLLVHIPCRWHGNPTSAIRQLCPDRDHALWKALSSF